MRRARRTAIALTLLSAAVLLPLAANYGKTGQALVEPPPGWEPWLLGSAAVAVLIGGAAAVFARRATYLHDRLPRARPKPKRGTDPR